MGFKEIEVKLFDTYRDAGTQSFKDKAGNTYYTWNKHNYPRVYDAPPFPFGTVGLQPRADGFLPHQNGVNVVPVTLKVVEEFSQEVVTVIKSQSYLIEYNYMSDGSLQVMRINGSLDKSKESFSAIELLGVLTRVQLEINQQISGKMPQPDIVKRTVIQD